MKAKPKAEEKPNPLVLQIMFGINGVLFLVMSYLAFTRFDKVLPGMLAVVTGLAAVGCWFQLSRLKPAPEEDPGPLGEK